MSSTASEPVSSTHSVSPPSPPVPSEVILSFHQRQKTISSNPPPELTASQILQSGYLLKRGRGRKTWKKRWFVLRPSSLSYYKSEEEYELRACLPTSDILAAVPIAASAQQRRPHVFALLTKTKTFYLQAQSESDLSQWIDTVKSVISTANANAAAGFILPGGTFALPLSPTLPPTISPADQQLSPLYLTPVNPNPFAATASSSGDQGPIAHITAEDVSTPEGSSSSQSQHASPLSSPTHSPRGESILPCHAALSVPIAHEFQLHQQTHIQIQSQMPTQLPTTLSPGTVVRSGCLHKLTTLGLWKKRWCVLYTDKLCIYKKKKGESISYSSLGSDTHSAAAATAASSSDALPNTSIVTRKRTESSTTPAHSSSVNASLTSPTTISSTSALHASALRYILPLHSLQLDDEPKWKHAFRIILSGRSHITLSSSDEAISKAWQADLSKWIIHAKQQQQQPMQQIQQVNIQEEEKSIL